MGASEAPEIYAEARLSDTVRKFVCLGEHAGYTHVKGILEMAARNPDAARETVKENLQKLVTRHSDFLAPEKQARTPHSREAH